ncbi:MAG TPA: hypothetical protein VGM62_10465 [Chthoniobacterales bacterium]|jgi:hypothetical protein
MGLSLAFGQPRRFSGLGKSLCICICLTVFLVCSCEKHQPGEYPEVQRDLSSAKNQPGAAAESPTAAPMASATPTPAEFFPTKPR